MLADIFDCIDGEVLVKLTSSHLSWKYVQESERDDTIEVPINEVICLKDVPCHITGYRSFTVHFINPLEDNKLSKGQVTFTAMVEICEIWHNKFQAIFEEACRPRKLLVFINPVSGKKKAVKIYHNKVAPLFALCDVTCDVVVTSAKNEARDILEKRNLDGIDGVISIGGDGLYCECLNGVMRRSQTDAGINYNSHLSAMISASLPIGIIPAGSGDLVVQFLHKTRDVTTAALRIIAGDIRNINMVSLHQGNRLSAFSGLLTAFGLSGDIMRACEDNRWMGPARYLVMSLKTLLNRRMVEAVVEYKAEVDEDLELEGYKEVTENNRIILKRAKSVQPGWRKIQGRYFGVDTWVTTLVPSDDKCEPQFDDDAMTAMLVSKCTRKEHVKHFQKLSELRSDCFEYDFIRKIRTTAYRVKLSHSPEDAPYYVNCDGEPIIVDHAQFDVRLHEQVVKVFGRK